MRRLLVISLIMILPACSVRRTSLPTNLPANHPVRLCNQMIESQAHDECIRQIVLRELAATPVPPTPSPTPS